MRLSESRVVVTGASSGIGKALVEQLLEHGAIVVGIDREETEINSPGFILVKADLSFTPEVRASYERAKAIMGSVDLYVANAGQARYGSDDQLTEEDTRALWMLNVMAVVEASRLMREDHGETPYHFIAVSSAMAKLPLPGYAFYASTKAAVAAYIQSLRFELSSNQSAHLVYPVATLTDFFVVSGQKHRSWFAQTPQHVAQTILKGLQTNRLDIHPSMLFRLLDGLLPIALRIYRYREKRLFRTVNSGNQHRTLDRESQDSMDY
jgi:uncharacterized protein